jgi:hypothetical protein
MEGEINTTIVKLKQLLSEKYGDDFNKFYLVQNNEKWEGLIKSTPKKGEKPGQYYSIEDENVVLDN